MMKNSLTIAFGLAAFPAAATPSVPGPVASEKATYELGSCIVKSDREMAARLMRDLPPASTQVAIGGLRLGKCTSGSPAVRAITLRGSIAQALLLRDFPRFGVPPRITPSHFVQFDLPVETGTNTDARTAALYKMSDCVVRNQGIKIERLFRADIGSNIEGRLIDYLAPTIQACQGANVRVTRTDFRSALAQSAYKVSVRYWLGELYSAE
jgi:hypothetical protein